HRQGIPLSKQATTEELTRLARLLKYETLDGLYVGVADGHITSRAVVDRLAKLLREGKSQSEEQLPAVVQPFGRTGMARGTFGGTAKRQSRKTADIGIWVEGLDDVMVRLARCCAPVVGDEIVGFVTKGRGISVHRSDCANGIWLATKSNQQLIEVEWNREAKGAFPVQIEVV
ncbi:GTP diphosphokinase, partial [mine drainage metagenome]